MIVALTVLVGVASIATVITVIRSKDVVVALGTQQLSDSLELSISIERRIEHYRAYLLNGSQEFLTALAVDRQQFLAKSADLRAEVQDPRALRLLSEVSEAESVASACRRAVVGG
ncbi:hypothetical protein [Actinoplanes solisilvae]|uniref:hypothetical protein n=1 Tax=Actinoplanes solisilvae TaxID=2486853 RepID=UPI000FD8F09C|nr:hypothetical protein [Actinoplanes solisilvae]